MTEEQGIEAIIALQEFAGIEETVEKARTGWREMNELDREKTQIAYQVLLPERYAQTMGRV